jgi:hypothetical protein
VIYDSSVPTASTTPRHSAKNATYLERWAPAPAIPSVRRGGAVGEIFYSIVPTQNHTMAFGEQAAILERQVCAGTPGTFLPAVQFGASERSDQGAVRPPGHQVIAATRGRCIPVVRFGASERSEQCPVTLAAEP